MMEIRHAEEADIPRIVDMVRRFHAETLDTEFSESRVLEVTTALMRFGAVFVTERGFLAGTIIQNLSDDGFTAHEVGWWSEDGRGGDLAKAFEEWAKEKGCNAVEFSFPVNRSRVSAVLRRWGFAPVTNVMRKEI